MCHMYMRPEPEHDEGGRAGEGAERSLHPLEAPGRRAHDHPREREQQQQRSDVPEQNVLDHVGGEEVVVAQPVDRGGERRQQRQHRPGEGQGLERPGPAAPGLAAGFPEPPHVDARQQGQRSQHGGIGQPVELGVRRSLVTRHVRDCVSGVPTGNARRARLRPCPSGSYRSWRRRCAGAAVAPPAAPARSAGSARARSRGSARRRCRPPAWRRSRRWPTRARPGSSCGR